MTAAGTRDRDAPGGDTATGPTYVEAIRLALDDALAEDPGVFCYGQDIGGTFGGAFKATKGLAEKYPGRIINAPICEDAMAGVAIGAALEGARAVIEYQFSDFATVAFNQLVNNAATTYWRTGRSCPLTVRLPVGGTPGGGPFHCQMPDAWLSHHPGLVVVAPSTVADAYGMLRDAIRCNDPVMYCEHKYLYNRLRDPGFDPATAAPPLGAAEVRRHGGDCTLVSYGATVHDCLAAADQLANLEDIAAEVLDLRSLRPLDIDAVLSSVARTGRLVMVSEAFPFGGVAAELVARVANEGFHLLDAPPRRVTAMDTPIPYHPKLWAAHRPGPARIAAAVTETVRF